jgi:SpoVK/Ycf46/Vps4 family AAA+-type ATPase
VIVGLFTEVKRHKPSVIFIPNIDAWWAAVAGPAITTFTTMLRTIPPTDPVLLLGTADCEPKDLPTELLRDLFGFSKKNRAVIDRPNRVRADACWGGCFSADSI